MGDVGATSDRPEFGHELRIEHGAGTEPDDRRPFGGHGVRVGAHVSVRTPLRRDLRQVVSPVMRAVGPLASARDVRAIGSEPPSSSQIITGTLCADFRSDLGSLPVSAGVRAAARSSASRRTGTIVQLGAGRFVKLAQARARPRQARSAPVRCAHPGPLGVSTGSRTSGRAEGVDRSAVRRHDLCRSHQRSPTTKRSPVVSSDRSETAHDLRSSVPFMA